MTTHSGGSARSLLFFFCFRASLLHTALLVDAIRECGAKKLVKAHLEPGARVHVEQDVEEVTLDDGDLHLIRCHHVRAGRVLVVVRLLDERHFAKGRVLCAKENTHKM